jgi:hypothetical protein
MLIIVGINKPPLKRTTSSTIVWSKNIRSKQIGNNQCAHDAVCELVSIEIKREAEGTFREWRKRVNSDVSVSGRRCLGVPLVEGGKMEMARCRSTE